MHTARIGIMVVACKPTPNPRGTAEMAILKVARMGHPVLRQKCQAIPTDKIQAPEVQRLIRDMFETMVEYNGVGLAAPQVHQPVLPCLARRLGAHHDQRRQAQPHRMNIVLADFVHFRAGPTRARHRCEMPSLEPMVQITSASLSRATP